MNKRILITGCSQGLGRALALHFGHLGFQVYAVGRNAEKLQELAEHINLIYPITADITTPTGRQAIVNAVGIVEPISIIHNAAIAIPSAIKDMSNELSQQHFATNTRAPALLNEIFSAALTKGQRVLSISSGAADLELVGLWAYCQSKAELEKQTVEFNKKFNLKGVFLGILRPGMIDTPMEAAFRMADYTDLPNKDFYIQAYEQGKLNSPDFVAKFIAWVLLQTNDADFAQICWDIHDKNLYPLWVTN